MYRQLIRKTGSLCKASSRRLRLAGYFQPHKAMYSEKWRRVK